MLVNANLNWNSVPGRPIDLSFFATNLLQKKYIIAYSGGWTSTGGESGCQGEPRMFGVRLRYRFGAECAP